MYMLEKKVPGWLLNPVVDPLRCNVNRSEQLIRGLSDLLISSYDYSHTQSQCLVQRSYIGSLHFLALREFPSSRVQQVVPSC
jgi:hypothetical protein